MKYFNIDTTVGNSFSPADLLSAQIPGFNKTINFTDAFHVLEEQCRPLGVQPKLYLNNVRIVSASKKFISRDRRYKESLSNRAIEYMKFVENLGAV